MYDESGTKWIEICMSAPEFIVVFFDPGEMVVAPLLASRVKRLSSPNKRFAGTYLHHCSPKLRISGKLRGIHWQPCWSCDHLRVFFYPTCPCWYRTSGFWITCHFNSNSQCISFRWLNMCYTYTSHRHKSPLSTVPSCFATQEKPLFISESWIRCEVTDL